MGRGELPQRLPLENFKETIRQIFYDIGRFYHLNSNEHSDSRYSLVINSFA